MFLEGEGDTHRRLWSSSDSPRQATKLLSPHFSSPMEATQSIASTGSRGGSAILGSHITSEDSLAVGLHRAMPQHKWQLFPWGTTPEGLCYVTVNWYVTASKCSWRKACASNNTPACPDHLLGLLISTTLNELCTVLAHQHVYVKYVCWAREIDSHIKTAERSAQDKKKYYGKRQMHFEIALIT